MLEKTKMESKGEGDITGARRGKEEKKLTDCCRKRRMDVEKDGWVGGIGGIERIIKKGRDEETDAVWEELEVEGTNRVVYEEG